MRCGKGGLERMVTTGDLRASADLVVELKIAGEQTRVTVTEKSTAFANSDGVYLQLRKGGLGDTFRCENFILPIDVGTFEFKSGTLTFLGKISTFETGAVFVGQGHFTLKPVVGIDNNEMVRRSGSPTAEEDFTEAVFRFSPGQFSQFAPSLGSRAETPAEAATALEHWKEKVRHRHEVPEGMTQTFLDGETIDNTARDGRQASDNQPRPPLRTA